MYGAGTTLSMWTRQPRAITIAIGAWISLPGSPTSSANGIRRLDPVNTRCNCNYVS